MAQAPSRKARRGKLSDASEPAGPTLGDVLASLAVIDLVCAPRGLDVAVGEPVINDPAFGSDIHPGAIVLGVGATEKDATNLVDDAGRQGAAAVALKIGDTTGDALRDVAQTSGVALLALPPEMTWSQAHSLIRTAVTATTSEGPSSLPFGDLFGLANAVAAMVGGAVTIEDRQSRVLAYSSQEREIDEPRRQTILGRQVPQEWLRRLEDAGVFRRLWAGEVVRYQAGPGFDLQPRLAVAVRAADVILGSIWAAEGERPLHEGAEQALREAARIAALHMIRHRASGSLERSTRGDLVRTIFEGTGSVDAIAYRLGVRPDDTFAVLAFEPQESDDIEDALQRERVLDLVALYGEAFRHRSAPLQLDRTIYVLFPGADPNRPERLVALARDIVASARDSLGVRLRGASGSIVAHLRDVPRSREEADQVLRALAEAGTGPDVADFESARDAVVLVELRDFASSRPHLRSRRVAALARHDAEHGTSYVGTLRAYLDAFGDIPRAARVANVHANTFRYRLRRLIELSGIDLGDPQERLLAELDLRLGLQGE